MNKLIVNPRSFKAFIVSFFFLSTLFFQANAKAMTIPFPVTIQCQDGEEVIYVPLIKGGAPLVPKCVANI